jgi:hypothetical protein
MKNKFVLTEEESKRILSLHKEKIDQERINLIENVDSKKILTEAIWDRVRNKILECRYNKEKATMSTNSLNKLAYNIKNWPSDVQWSMDFADRSSILGRSKKAANWVAQQIYKSKSKGNFCKLIDLYNKNYADDNFFEDYDNAFDGDISFSILSAAVNKVMGTEGKVQETPPTPTPSKKGCPSIVKSFTDAGYTQITVERYKELANDKTRVRKYKFCPVTKKNLYFAKPQVTQTGPAPTPVPDGGETNTGGGGQTYPFDYDTILKAFPPDEIINPFEQGGEEEVQSTIVTDKMYAEF